MNLIVEFCVVFLICMAGEWISALLPFTQIGRATRLNSSH